MFKGLSQSAIDFSKAYARLRCLNTIETEDLTNFLALQYSNAPAYVKLVLLLYFNFVFLVCLLLKFKRLSNLKKNEFSDLCFLLSNAKISFLRKVTVSVRSILEFKILEMEHVRCQTKLM